VFPLRDDYVVIALKDRKTPSDTEFEAQSDEIAERLLAIKQATWLRAFVRDLREKAENQGLIESEMVAPPAAKAAEGAAEDMGAEEKRAEPGKDRDDESAPAEKPAEQPAEESPKGAQDEAE
jgi:hypothetical protein